MTIPQEDREDARGLYVIDGLTFDQVTKATGIAASTLKIWSEEEGWRESRREHRKSEQETKANILKLRKELYAEALKNCDPQMIYAAVRLESVAAKLTPKEASPEPDIDRPKIFLEDMEFIAETLREIDPEGLKVLATHFETIIQRFKTAHSS